MVFSFFLFFHFVILKIIFKNSKILLAQLVKFTLVGKKKIPNFPKLIFVQINDKFGYKQKNYFYKKKGTVLLPDQIDGLDCDPWTDGWRTCGERGRRVGPDDSWHPLRPCEHGARPAGARRRVEETGDGA
jgi:hypothetical protein